MLIATDVRMRIVVRALAQANSKRTTEALFDVVKTVSSDTDVDTLVANIVDATYKLLNTERVTLYLVDSARQELYIAVSQVRVVCNLCSMELCRRRAAS